MKTGWCGMQRYKLGVGMTILSSKVLGWSLVLFNQMGYQFTKGTQERLLKLDKRKERKATKRALPESRTKEAKRRNDKRKNNRKRAKSTSDQAIDLPYLNQNVASNVIIQHIAGIIVSAIHLIYLEHFSSTIHRLTRGRVRQENVIIIKLNNLRFVRLDL